MLRRLTSIQSCGIQSCSWYAYYSNRLSCHTSIQKTKALPSAIGHAGKEAGNGAPMLRPSQMLGTLRLPLRPRAPRGSSVHATHQRWETERFYWAEKGDSVLFAETAATPNAPADLALAGRYFMAEPRGQHSRDASRGFSLAKCFCAGIDVWPKRPSNPESPPSSRSCPQSSAHSSGAASRPAASRSCKPKATTSSARPASAVTAMGRTAAPAGRDLLGADRGRTGRATSS